MLNVRLFPIAVSSTQWTRTTSAHRCAWPPSAASSPTCWSRSATRCGWCRSGSSIRRGARPPLVRRPSASRRARRSVSVRRRWSWRQRRRRCRRLRFTRSTRTRLWFKGAELKESKKWKRQALCARKDNSKGAAYYDQTHIRQCNTN